jgi:hypothetical protein
MSYAERLAQLVEKAPARVAYNAQAKPAYDWQREANNKRSIR